MIKGRKILITGGAGFIGSALAHRLINDNTVVVYDNFSRGKSAEDLHGRDNYFEVKGDVLVYASLNRFLITKVLEGVDTIIHCAAVAGIDTVAKQPTKTMDVILAGTKNLLTLACKLKVKQFINFSTSEVFGASVFQKTERAETTVGMVGETRWSYAVSKLAAEHLVKAYATEFDLPVTIVRPFNVYGAGQIGEGAIQQFILRAINNEDMKIHGNGVQIRSWCYISDMIDAIELCLEEPEAIGEVFNIGNPRATVTILELAKRIKRLAGSKSEIIHIPKDGVDVELRVPNIEKARKLLGYEPKVDLDEGIKKTIGWYSEKV